jgi:hypothetical protein
MLIACIVMAGARSFAQDGRRAPYPAREECPQGRQIRAQKAYPSTMTDCQVLDADTAAENQKLKLTRRPAPVVARQPPKPTTAAMPATRAATATAPAAPLPQQAAAPPVPSPPKPAERAVAAPEPQHGDYEARTVGNWMTSAKEDRFGDGGTFIAVVADGQVVLGVRCIQKHLSIGVGEFGFDQKPVAKGDLFAFKFRVDALPIVETAGAAISDRLIQVDTEKDLVRSIRDGRETAVRVTDTSGATITHIFNTAGSRKAFADLSRECPLD